MKKYLSLILAVVIICSAVASCGKAPDFIPINDSGNISMNWASSSGKNINSDDYKKGFVEAYNSVTETKKYDEGDNEDALWRIVLISEEEGKDPDIFLVSYLGDNRFNVSVNGSVAAKASEDKNVKYLVENEKLANYANDELVAYKEVSAAVNVAFSFGAGTPDADGNIREADEPIGETKQTVIGNEQDLPSVTNAIKQALITGAVTDDYEMPEGASCVESINGHKTSIKNGSAGEAVEILMWQAAVNGEVVPSGEEASTVIEDGDEITVTYVVTTVDNAG